MQIGMVATVLPNQPTFSTADETPIEFPVCRSSYLALEKIKELANRVAESGVSMAVPTATSHAQRQCDDFQVASKSDEPAESYKLPKYVPFTVEKKWRNVDPPIKCGRRSVKRFLSPVITEYVDTESGEIVEASSLRDDPDVFPVIRFSERYMQRQSLLDALRPEIREFAVFVLRFRNKRRGITPGIEGLVKMYAKLSQKQACHVRRYIKALVEGGILAGESLLQPLFQIAGSKTKAAEHLSEDSVASAGFALQMLKKREFPLQSINCIGSAGGGKVDNSSTS